MYARSPASVLCLAFAIVALLGFSSFIVVGDSAAQTPLTLKPRSLSADELVPVPKPQIRQKRAVMKPVPSMDHRKTLKPNDPSFGQNKRLQELDRALNAARGKSDSLKSQANVLDTDIQRLRQGLVSAARLIQDHEARVSRLILNLAELNRSLKEKSKNLKVRRKQMGGVLLALQRVAMYPPEALIVRSIPPGDAVRSAILLRTTVPELERRAITLRDDLLNLRQTREEVERRQGELASATTELESQRKLLRTLLGRKSRLRRRTMAQSNQAEHEVRNLTRQARSIRDLMARLEMLRKKREKAERIQKDTESNTQPKSKVSLRKPKDFTGKPLNAARGRLPYPVVGSIIAQFGEKAQGGLSHKGLTIETRSGAQVISSYEGRVVFSGPFRGYGELLIIEHHEGYHTLLAGMSRIDGVVGQWLLAGEPVGMMGTSASRKKNEKPTLYLEMRYKGQPINPLPWLATRKGKAGKRKVNG